MKKNSNNAPSSTQSTLDKPHVVSFVATAKQMIIGTVISVAAIIGGIYKTVDFLIHKPELRQDREIEELHLENIEIRKTIHREQKKTAVLQRDYKVQVENVTIHIRDMKKAIDRLDHKISSAHGLAYKLGDQSDKN